MLEKIKAWPIFKALATFAAALAFGLAAAGVARRNAQAKALEQAAANSATAATGRALERAAKQTEKAEAHKTAAETRRAEAEARLDNLGNSDETLADLVNGWNTDRLRN